jgi:hypothetical protein
MPANADVKVENTSKGATIKIEAKDKTDVSQVQAHARMMKDCMQASSMGDPAHHQRSGSMGSSSQTSPSSSSDTSATSDPASTNSAAGGTSPMGAEPASDPNTAKDEKDPRAKTGAGGQ